MSEVVVDKEPEYPKPDTPVNLPHMMAKKLEILRERGGRAMRIVVQVGSDVAIVSEYGRVDWHDDHHG